MKKSGRTISDADKARMKDMLGESGKTISDADKAKMRSMLGESGKTISDADKARMKDLMGYKKGGMVDYDAKVAMLDYPGTKGVGMPTGGKQQLTGKGFRGTF